MIIIVQFINDYTISFDELFERELLYNFYFVKLLTLNNNDISIGVLF